MLTFDDVNLTEPIRIYDKFVSDETTHPTYVDTFAAFRSSVRDGDIQIPKVSPGEPLKNECEHFLDSISQGLKPRTDGWEGARVVRRLEIDGIEVWATMVDGRWVYQHPQADGFGP